MTQLTEHWEQIFQSKSDAELGWFEQDFTQTFKFIEKAGVAPGATIFMPGAGTTKLVDELCDKGFQLVVNDLSSQAIQLLQQRLAHNQRVTSFVGSIAEPMPESFAVDFWLDRAVLHFLLEEKQIQGYFDNLKKSVKPGGFVLLAEFAKHGAKKCAGLELKQYDINDMQIRLGAEFQLVEGEEYTFVNPFNQDRPYVYGLFQRGF